MSVPAAQLPSQLPPGPPPATRVGLLRAVVACVAGAGLALLAVTRVWSTTLRERPAPLPPIDVSHTGSSALGWVAAVALVGLAGAGALLATRGGARVGVGALLGLVGIVVLGGGIDGLRLADGARVIWPTLVGLGGLAIAWSGLQAVRHGASWPGMSPKYDRQIAKRTSVDRPATNLTMWDDLDRGVDPTESDR